METKIIDLAAVKYQENNNFHKPATGKLITIASAQQYFAVEEMT